MVRPGEAIRRSHFLTKGARQDGTPSLSEKGSLKGQGPRLVKEVGKVVAGVSAGAGISGSKWVGRGCLRKSLGGD